MTPSTRRSYRFWARLAFTCADITVFIGSFVLAFIAVHDTFDFSDIHWLAGFKTEEEPTSLLGIAWMGMPSPMWQDFTPYVASILLPLPFIRFVVMSRLDCYQLTGEISLADDIIETFRGVTIGSILLIVLAFSAQTGAGETRFIAGRRIFPVDWMLCVAGCVAIRLLFRTFQKRVRLKGYNLTPVILLGDGSVAETILSDLSRDLTIGYRVVRQIKVDPNTETLRKALSNLPEIIKETGASEVFVTGKNINQRDLLPVLMKTGWDVRFKVVPDLMGLRPKKVEITRLRFLPLLELFVDPIRGATGKMKRAMDLLFTTAAMLFLSIPMLIIALLIKLDSKGPVLFRQTRMGQDFRPFPMYKFRSMHTNTDSQRHLEFMKKVIEQGQGVTDAETGKKIFKEKDDPRITRVGRFIRRFSMDELPQLFNVLKGEMSIVGPRPPLPYEVAMYRESHLPRMSAKPGITGVWQVSGRNAVSFDDMVQMDITYMENWSILTDIKIILQTIPVVLFPRDTY